MGRIVDETPVRGWLFVFGFCDDDEVLGVTPSAGVGVVGSVAGCHEELAFTGFVFEVPSGG